jgi:PAS domain-containing protein
MQSARTATTPTGRERTFGEDEIIVSKTDVTGKITYANHVFLRVSGYTEDESVGAPHSTTASSKPLSMARTRRVRTLVSVFTRNDTR